MAFQDDFTKLPQQIIVDRINNDNAVNGAALTPALLDFGLPTAAGGASPARNTDLTLTAKSGSGYSGSVTVHYNRVDLSTVPGTRSTTFPKGDAVKVSDMISEINAAYGINLQSGDYVDGNLPTFTGTPNEEYEFQLTADADALCWFGSVMLTVKSEDIALSSVITEQTLGGLVYTQPA